MKSFQDFIAEARYRDKWNGKNHPNIKAHNAFRKLGYEHGIKTTHKDGQEIKTHVYFKHRPEDGGMASIDHSGKARWIRAPGD